MYKYTHLSKVEQDRIYQGLREQLSIRFIAGLIDRYPSTISREIARTKDHIGYYPAHAQEKRKQRRAKAKKHKINEHQKLKEYVALKLHQKWSPRVIAGRWNLESCDVKISAESIYRWVYSEETKHLELNKLLIRSKRKRGIAYKPVRTSDHPNKTPVALRPESINNRQEPGHYEADLMFNSGSQSANVLTVIERKSRYATLVKNETKQSGLVYKGLEKTVIELGIKSMTFDNGSEFANHQDLKDNHGIETYFCKPGRPWEKGAIEHLNGMLRSYLPFELDSSFVTQDLLDEIADSINHKPRKILGFLNPCEVFNGKFQTENMECCTS